MFWHFVLQDGIVGVMSADGIACTRWLAWWPMYYRSSVSLFQFYILFFFSRFCLYEASGARVACMCGSVVRDERMHGLLGWDGKEVGVRRTKKKDVFFSFIPVTLVTSCMRYPSKCNLSPSLFNFVLRILSTHAHSCIGARVYHSFLYTRNCARAHRFWLSRLSIIISIQTFWTVIRSFLKYYITIYEFYFIQQNLM